MTDSTSFPRLRGHHSPAISRRSPIAHSQGKNNAEKEGWRNRNQKLRTACRARYGVLGMAYQAMAQDAATPYPNMAPIDQYLMADRDAEIALARVLCRSPLHAMQRYRFLRRHGSRQR